MCVGYVVLGLHCVGNISCDRGLSLKCGMSSESMNVFVIGHGSDAVVSFVGHSNNKLHFGSDR